MTDKETVIASRSARHHGTTFDAASGIYSDLDAIYGAYMSDDDLTFYRKWQGGS